MICTSMTTGVVTGNHRRKSGGSRPSVSYTPEFSYTVKGILYNQCSAIGTSKPRFTEGQEITVFYAPDNPDDYYIAEDGLSNKIFYVCLVIGILLMTTIIHLSDSSKILKVMGIL